MWATVLYSRYSPLAGIAVATFTNGRRNELTGAERKSFAAEVGRLIAKLAENCQDGSFANGNNSDDGNWVDDLAINSGFPVRTIYNWWSAFCKDAGLKLTPKQAANRGMKIDPA